MRIYGRRAEVNQLDLAVVYDLDIFWRNVLMNNAVLVQSQQRFQHGTHDVERLVYVQSAAPAVYKAVQAHAVEIFHYDIRGVVGQEEIVNFHYAVQILDGGEYLRFLNERGEPIVEHLGVVGVVDVDGTGMRHALRIALREKLFNRHACAGQHVVRLVRNAEAAAPERHAYEIAPREKGAHGDCLRRGLVVRGALVALGANVCARVERAEAVKAYGMYIPNVLHAYSINHGREYVNENKSARRGFARARKLLS